MRRIVLTLGTALALVAPAAPALAAEPPALGAKVAACDTGLAPESRTAEFSGSMPGADGADVLTMRFTLEQRKGAGAWKPLAAPSFGRWERSAHGAGGFVYAKRVERLLNATTYRVRVQFRWLDEAGEVLKSATRRSPVCKQPDLRPDLTVAAVTTERLGGDQARYVVQLRNSGLGALVGSTGVGLVVNGGALAAQPLAGLPAAAVTKVVFEGPVCAPGSTLVATVDGDRAVAEPVEGDNALRVPCPSVQPE